jgi:aspartate dehydrogenase
VNVLLIGFGAIAREVLRQLRPDEAARVAAILVRPVRVEEVRARVPPGIRAIGSLAEIDDLAEAPEVAVECAGHAAVAEYGPAILRRGIDLIVISIGALADRALHRRLAAAAEEGSSKMILPAGAIAGADGLAAARVGGLSRVTYISRKPPKAWKGTPAERSFDLDRLSGETVLYRGAADEAARLYPQNANVAATIALAGAGWEATEVALVADPEARGNIHHIHAEGAFGALDIEMRGKPLPENPKSSTLAALSLVRAIRNRADPVEV